MWDLIAAFCGAYVFIGIIVTGLLATTGNGMLVVFSIIAYVLNLALLRYAVKKPW